MSLSITLGMLMRLGSGAGSAFPFRIALKSFTDSSGLLSIETDRPGSGVFHFARYDVGASPAAFNGTAWTGADATDTVNAATAGDEYDLDLGGTTGQQYRVRVYHLENGELSNPIDFTFTADNTAPALAASARGANGSLLARLTTDEANGTVYTVLVAQGVGTTPSYAQIIAGQDSTGAAALSYSVSAITSAAISFTTTGLTNGSGYTVYAFQEDLHGNRSAIVSATGTPTASPAQVSQVGSVHVYNCNDPLTTGTFVEDRVHVSEWTTDSITLDGTDPNGLLVVAVYGGYGNHDFGGFDFSVNITGGPELVRQGAQENLQSPTRSVAVFTLKKADFPGGAFTLDIAAAAAPVSQLIVHVVEFGGVYQGAPVDAVVTGENRTTSLTTTEPDTYGYLATTGSDNAASPVTPTAPLVMLEDTFWNFVGGRWGAIASLGRPGLPLGSTSVTFASAGLSPQVCLINLRAA